MLTFSTSGRFESFLKMAGLPVRDRHRLGQWTPMAPKPVAYAVAVVAKLRVLAPYAVIALFVPGGSLMAIFLWVYRRQKKVPAFPGR